MKAIRQAVHATLKELVPEILEYKQPYLHPHPELFPFAIIKMGHIGPMLPNSFGYGGSIQIFVHVSKEEGDGETYDPDFCILDELMVKIHCALDERARRTADLDPYILFDSDTRRVEFEWEATTSDMEDQDRGTIFRRISFGYTL